MLEVVTAGPAASWPSAAASWPSWQLLWQLLHPPAGSAHQQLTGQLPQSCQAADSPADVTMSLRYLQHLIPQEVSNHYTHHEEYPCRCHLPAGSLMQWHEILDAASADMTQQPAVLLSPAGPKAVATTKSSSVQRFNTWTPNASFSVQ